MKKMTPEEKDSLVLTAIFGNQVLFPKRPIQPHSTHDSTSGSGNFYGDCAPSGPCCAVGAAVLYHNLGPRSLKTRLAPTEAFAKLYNVSKSYACGVSAGFECALHLDIHDAFDLEVDYSRGFQVGKAAYEAIYGGGV